MKRFIYITMFITLLGCQVEQRESPANNIDEKKEGLINTLYDFNLAFVAADATQLERLLTDQYAHTNGSSAPYTKEIWLNYIKSRKEKIKAGTLIVDDYGMTEMEISFYGHTALVNGIVFSKGSENGVSFNKKFRVTHLWVLESDQWKRAAFHDGIIE